MNEALFFRILSFEDKAEALEQVVGKMDENVSDAVTYVADPLSFGRIPGSTFAYWVSENTRRIFARFPQMEDNERTVKQGLATADDFRFLRLYWEIPLDKAVLTTSAMSSEKILQQTFREKYWIPFAKGGAYSPYYSDLHLVVNWRCDAEELKNFKDPQTGKPFAYLRNTGFYFRPGLTWSRRTTSGISIRILPRGCIFADKGPAAFADDKEQTALLGLMNSQAFEGLITLQLGAADAAARSYEVGLVQRTPVPDFSSPQGERLGELAINCVNLKRKLDTANETNHIFSLPALLQVAATTTTKSYSAWQTLVAGVENQLATCQQEIDEIVFDLYGFSDQDRQAIEDALKGKRLLTEASIVSDENINSIFAASEKELIMDAISYSFGCPFGRWDIRFATRERPAPELPDPFAPLPACSSSMLVGEDGLPLKETPEGYPLSIKWDGILVDDTEHPDDIIRHVHEVLSVLWGERAEAIEKEICGILEIKDLREYFRKSGKGGFWVDHIQRYSKSRRKAPIYWLLQSSKRNYALWLYYHRLGKDILFKALVNYVEPKLRLEESRMELLRTQRKNGGLTGRETRQLEKQLERQENIFAELQGFRDRLRRVADLGLEPDLNDGVVLNIAPLWELVPWNEAKKYWEELLVGKYEWSSISKQLRAKGKVR